MELQLNLSQKQIISQKLIQSVNILQMNTQELTDFINEAALENPVIDIIQRKIRDVIMSAPEPEDYEALLDKVAKEFNEKA